MSQQTSQNLVKELESIPEFADASIESLNDLAAEATYLDLADGVTLYSYGAPSEEVFALLRGSVRYSGPGTLGHQVLEVRKGPALIGEAAALDGGTRMVTAQAIGQTRVVTIPADRWRALVRRDPGLGFGLAKRLAQVLRLQADRSGAGETGAT